MGTDAGLELLPLNAVAKPHAATAARTNARAAAAAR
jgi:hypothetical protein